VTSFALSLLLPVSLFAAVSDTTNNAVSSSSAANYAVSATASTNSGSQTSGVADSLTTHSPAPNTYAAAYQDTQENGKPLVVLVGASWCPACQSMKTSTMPGVAAQGGLANVAFAYVNVDAQHDLAGQLMEGGMIPQLVMYEKSGDGWKLTRLVGAQSVETVQGFIGPATQRAIALKSSPTQTPTATQPASAIKQPTAAQKSIQQSAAG